MKNLYLFFILSLFCFDVYSQSKSKTQSKFGIKFGSGLQSITGCPFQTKPRIAFMGGIWVQLKISRTWYMQAELTQIGKGIGLGAHQPKNVDYWLNLNYFEVPILFQYNKRKAFYEFGPSVAALINTGEYTNGGTLPYQTDLYPISKKDLSFNVGAGYIFDEKWRIVLRLTHSVLPVRQQLPFASHAVYNRGIIFAVSRQLHLKSIRTKQSEDKE